MKDNKLTIRYECLSIRDLDDICRIMNNVRRYIKDNNLDIWDEEYPSRSIYKHDLTYFSSRGLRVNGELTSYICFANASDIYDLGFEIYPFSTKNCCVLYRLMVDNKYMNMHLATKLISEVIEEIKMNKCFEKKFNKEKMTIGLLCEETNTKPIHIYEKLGFVQTNFIKFPFGNYFIYELEI